MKTHFTPYIYILFLLGFNFAFSQQFELNIAAKSYVNNPILESIKYKKTPHNKTSILLEIDAIKAALSQKGYLKNKLDSLYKKDAVYTAIFSLGLPFEDIVISYKDQINPSFLKENTLIFNDSTFTIAWKSINPFLNNLVSSYEKNGLPFTQIQLVNIHFKNDKAFANLEISETKQRTIDDIVIKGYVEFPQSFLSHYLNLKTKTVFNTEKINLVSGRIHSLTFVEEIKPPEIMFNEDKTTLYLYIKKKQTNTFDGLLGFTNKEKGSGLLFNGYLDINLNNIFNSGESLALLFKSNGNEQQKLNLKGTFPYAFKSKMTPAINVNFYKQDTSFINVDANLEIQYPINYKSKIGLSLNQESSTNLLTSTNTDIQSYNTFYFGLSYTYSTFNKDNLFNEKFNFNIHVLKGTKNIGIVKENQTKITLTTSYLWLLNYKNAIYIKNNSAILNTSNYVTNELFRIGGYNSIRGFNEESIFATSYSILNLEYRHKTSKTDYFYTVSGFGFYSNQLVTINSNLYSFGLGYLFSTKTGRLNLSYVLGKVKTKDLKIGDAKFHVNFKVEF